MIENERKSGYLASIANVPPLIFRFQFNPESLSDKKSFSYESANGFGQWGFDQTSAASGFFGTLGGLYKDVKEIGALLVGTKPLEAKEGGDRVISMDFVLDARVPGPKDGDDHYKGSIEPDLAILRSFMYPSWDVIDVGKMLFSGFKSVPCWNRPPECSLKYGGISTTCVMTDLSIKIVAFLPDGKPARAEVSVSLKAQPFSHSPIIEFAERFYLDIRGLVRKNIGEDMLEVTGIQTLIDVFK
jgi:hypothetical protein